MHDWSLVLVSPSLLVLPTVLVCPILSKMRFGSTILYLAAFAEATITFEDPSDALSPSYWAADNAILADYQNASTALYQFIAITGSYVYNAMDGNITRASLYGDANDTSVLVVANSSEVYLSHSTVTKLGYSSDLTQAAFFGKSPWYQGCHVNWRVWSQKLIWKSFSHVDFFRRERGC